MVQQFTLYGCEPSLPRMNAEVREAMLLNILDNGLMLFTGLIVEELEFGNEIVGEYLDKLEKHFIKNKILNTSIPGTHTLPSALKVGASIAIQGYRETGFPVIIDLETIKEVHEIGKQDGVPDTYITASTLDPVLSGTFNDILELTEFSSAHQYHIRELLDTGAGVARMSVGRASLAA